MVNARWAVACLLAAVLSGLSGCAAGKAAKATPATAGGSGASSADNFARTPMPAAVPGGAISEENVADTPPQAEGIDKANAAAKPVKPPSQMQDQATAYSGPEYRLGPEDQVRVSVWENRELTLDLVVRPDGKISMPLIQDVVAEGLTASELSQKIQEKLLVYIKDPQVSVILLQVNAPKFYVMGNVTRPGTYPLRGDTSVLQALSLAGGFTQFASPRSIKLIRNTGGKQEVRRVNYNKLIEEGGEGNYLLKSGDTIVVP